MALRPGRLLATLGLAVGALGALGLAVGALGRGAVASTPSTEPAGAAVRPFREVQASDVGFEADPLDPTRGVMHVTTTKPMICAVVWGETDALGRFNNSLAMSGTGIAQHDVYLPDVEPGRTYHYVIAGVTADGTLYRSEPATFVIAVPDDDAAGGGGTGPPPGEPGTNVALGAAVEVSSEFSPAFAGAHAVDGDVATEWSTAGDGDAGWITIDLGAPTDIAGVEFVTRSMADGTAITTSFTVSVDGGDPQGPFPAASPATSAVAPLAVTGQVLRFDVDESTGGNVGAAEVRVFADSGSARSPEVATP